MRASIRSDWVAAIASRDFFADDVVAGGVEGTSHSAGAMVRRTIVGHEEMLQQEVFGEALWHSRVAPHPSPLPTAMKPAAGRGD